jgi:hypothetical protein
VLTFFLVEAALFVGGVTMTIYSNIDSSVGLLTNASSLELAAIGQLLATLVAAGFVTWGAFILPSSRIRAYEQFRRATLVNLFLTQFFMFARTEFGALPGFIFNLVLLGLIGYAIRQEQRLGRDTLSQQSTGNRKP